MCWDVSRPFWTKTTELCFNYYAIIGCFYYGKLEKKYSFENIEESNFK